MRLFLLIFEQCSTYDRGGFHSDVKNIVCDLHGPLHICRFFHRGFQHLEPSVVKLAELLHVATLSLLLA